MPCIKHLIIWEPFLGYLQYQYIRIYIYMYDCIYIYVYMGMAQKTGMDRSAVIRMCKRFDPDIVIRAYTDMNINII